MWLFTRYGFFSVSCHEPGKFQIRARCQRHLEALLMRFYPELKPFPILETPFCDYPFRMFGVPADLWGRLVQEMAEEQTWSNFKNEAEDWQLKHGMDGCAYHNVLLKIWSVTRQLTRLRDFARKRKQKGALAR